MTSHAALPDRAPLPFLSVLRVTGPDATAFLQGQLTNDVRLLADGRTQLAALTTPKGRVIALLRLRQVGGTFYALVPTELVDKVVGVLRRYVLRAKVKLDVASDLVVTAAPVPVAGPAEEPDASTVTFDYAPGRRLAASSAEATAAVTTATDESGNERLLQVWLAADIACGLPQVWTAASEAFVPQMLNLDLLEGLSFNKGCYTGQEIVTRTQHLGRIKRRTLRYRLATGPAPAPLDPLYRDAGKVAEVVMSAVSGAGVELLAVTSLDTRGLSLRTGDGRVAEPVELPYPIDSSA